MAKDKDKSKKDKHKKSSKRHRDDSDSEEERQRKSRKLVRGNCRGSPHCCSSHPSPYPAKLGSYRLAIGSLTLKLSACSQPHEHPDVLRLSHKRPLWQADKVVAHLQKKARPAAEDAPSGAFVWKKKVEKQLNEGASVRDLTAAAERKRQEDRLVSF